MERIENAFLMNWAFNGSKELESQRNAALRDASGPIGDGDLAAYLRGEELMADLKRSRVVQAVLPS